MPPPRKRAPAKAAKATAPKKAGYEGPNNASNPDSPIGKWHANGRGLGVNKADKALKSIQHCGPDLPPGRPMTWLPKPEEVPPKPTAPPEMEYPGPPFSRLGGPEWQLHSYMMDNARELEAAGEPWVIERVWEIRWVPPDDRRCRSRSVGKYSEWQGNRCTSLAIRGGRVCNKHGGKLGTVKKAAQRALAIAALPAAEKLIHIALTKSDVADSDRIKAIVQILDRAGVEGRQVVELEVRPFQEVLERVYSENTGQSALGSDEEVEGIDFELMEDDEDG